LCEGLPYSDVALVEELRVLLEGYSKMFGYYSLPSAKYTTAATLGEAVTVDVDIVAAEQDGEPYAGTISETGKTDCFFCDKAKGLRSAPVPLNGPSGKIPFLSSGDIPALLYGMKAGGGMLMREIVETLTGTLTGMYRIVSASWL
jgi:hypothetical protein